MSIGGTTFGCTVHLATRHRLVTVTRDWRSESLIMSSDVLTLARQSNFNCQLLPKIVTSEEAHCQGQSEQHTERSSAPYKICQKNCCHSISVVLMIQASIFRVTFFMSIAIKQALLILKISVSSLNSYKMVEIFSIQEVGSLLFKQRRHWVI